MKNLREFALTTKLDKIGFLPGDIIHGDLYIYFEKPAELHAIEIFFYGIGCGAWLDQCDDELEERHKGIEIAKSNEKGKKRKLVDVGLLLFGFSEPRNNRAVIHEQGRFVYEFEINVPENLPFTFKSPLQKDLGYVRYYLKAVLSRPKKRKKITRLPIVINELVDPDRPDLAFLPGSFQEKNLRTACLPTGSLSLECYLSKSHYKQGEKILIQALAQNCSTKVLKEMYAKLIRRVRCKSSFGTNTFTSNEASIRGTKIPAQSTVEWNKEEMRVPPVGPTIAGNREIRIDYMVRIGMYEDLGCEVHLDLPVVIGTVGLPDWNKNRNARLHQVDSKCSDRTSNKLLKYKDMCVDSKENTKPNPIIELNEVEEKQFRNDNKLNSNKDSSNTKPDYSQFQRLKEPVRDIQKALDDIDDDMSRIKRRISEAKQSVSKSFELDAEEPKNKETKTKPQLSAILPPVLTPPKEESDVTLDSEVGKEKTKDKKEREVLKETDRNIAIVDSKQKNEEIQPSDSLFKNSEFPSRIAKIEDTKTRESKLDLDKMNVSNETGNYFLNSLESNQTSSFQKMEIQETPSLINGFEDNDSNSRSDFGIFSNNNLKKNNIKAAETIPIEPIVEKPLDKIITSVKPDQKEVERPRVSLKKKDSYIEKEPLVIDFEGITHSIKKDAESLDEQVEQCLKNKITSKPSTNRLNKSMNCIDGYSSDEYSANALIIDFKSITKNEKIDGTKNVFSPKVDAGNEEKSTDLQNGTPEKSPDLHQYQNRYKGFTGRMNKSLDTINYYSSDSINSDNKLNEKDRSSYHDTYAKINDVEITQSIPTYSDTESVGTTIIKAEMTKSSLYLDAEVNVSSETYNVVENKSFNESIEKDCLINDFVDHAAIDTKSSDPIKSLEQKQDFDCNKISDETANIFIQLVAITTSLPYQTKNNFNNLIQQFLFHLQKDLGNSRICNDEEELQNLIYKAKEDFYQLQEERLFDNESKEKRRNVMHENISELKKGIKKFDDRFGNLRERFLQYNVSAKGLCRKEKIEELKVIFDTFSYDFDSFHQQFVRSVKETVKDHSYTAIENLKTAFNKFDDDFELARRNFFLQLENENDMSYLSNVFNKFDLSFECVRGDLMEDLKVIIDRLMEEMILQKSLKYEARNKTSVTNEWDDNDLYSDKDKLCDAKEIIKKYFISQKNDVIKNLEGMGYVIIPSETATVADELEIKATQSNISQLPDETPKSDFSLQSKPRSNTIENFQVLEIEDKSKADVYDIPLSKEWESKTDLVGQTNQLHFDDNVAWESVQFDCSPKVEEEEEEEIEHEITMNVSLSKENSSSLKKHLGKSSDTEDDLFPISDKSYERNFANYKGGYTPVPYTPLLEEDGASGDDRPLEKADLEINLVCGSTSDESVSSPRRIPAEYETVNQIEASQSPLQKTLDEQNDDNDKVFEALRNKFLQCLEDENGVKNSSLDFRNIKHDILNEFESTFGRLDDDFDEIRQSFINSLRNERNSYDTSTLDHIETNLNKFDDDFEDIRQKFIRSLKEDEIDKNESTFTEEETGINLFDANIDELRHKFMSSLRSSVDNEESDKMNKILSEQVFESDKPSEDEENIKLIQRNSFKKVKKSNSYKEKEQGHVIENDMKEIKTKEGITSSDTDGNFENQEETSIVSHSNDLSWLDLNTLGQFGPEEFSNVDSKCILPSCKEIVILHEPNDMPHFKKHSYTPQHIKSLQEKMNREKEKKSVEDDYSNDYPKKQKKGSAKIRTKIKSRSKFMADTHIVTDEPKHIETAGLANQSWLDLNTVGQIGPEEEICTDNQFVLPSGKEVIILGKGMDIENTEHIQVSTTDSKTPEVKRSLSGRETFERSLQRTPSVKRSNSKKVVEERKQSKDIENTILDRKSSSVTPIKDITDTIVSPKHIARRNSKNSQTSSPLLDVSYNSKENRDSLSRNSSLKKEKRKDFLIQTGEESNHEKLVNDESRLKEEKSENGLENTYRKSPLNSKKVQSRSPSKKVLNETFEAEIICEDHTSKSNEPFTSSKNFYGEDESFVESTSSGGDAIKEDTVMKENSSENNGGFLDRAKNYMKSIFQFNSSCSDASEKEEIVNKMGVLKETSDAPNKEKVCDTMDRAKQEQNQHRDGKPRTKQEQNNDSIKTRPKKLKSYVDMDATDNFIEDLSSLVTDETETSELATTGDSSLAILKNRRPGPEERYSTENNKDLLNSEVHMIVETSQLSELDEREEDSNMEQKPSYKEVEDGDAIDLDATENLIDDIYLVTDEPSEPITQITFTSNKTEEHFLNDKNIVVNQEIDEPKKIETEKSEKQHDVEKKEFDNEYILNKRADSGILEDKAMDNNSDCRLTNNDPFKLKSEKFTVTSDSSESEYKNEKRKSPFRDLPKMDMKISKHIGPEEISSADDKSLLALDKELIMQIEKNQINNKKQLVIDEGKAREGDNANNDVDEVDRSGMVGFKHGPEEYFGEQNIILPTENKVVKETVKSNVALDDVQTISEEKQISQNTCREIHMVADHTSLETNLFPQTILSYKNDALNVKKGLGVFDEIMNVKRVVQADVSQNILDQSKMTNDDVLTDTESIVFDVTVEKVVKDPKTTIWPQHNDQEMENGTMLSQYQKVDNTKEDKLDDLKMLHSIMYSDNELSCKDENISFDLINKQNLTQEIKSKDLEPLFLDTNGIKTESGKKQSQKLVSPSNKPKQKIRKSEGKKKSPDGTPGKQYTLLRPLNKRKEWKLDFGGNLRPATMKGKCSKKEFGTFVLVQDSTNSVKKMKKVKRDSQMKSNTKLKKFLPSQNGVREKEKEKEKKSRALKIINLTVEKDKEFKRLSKAIKKKLSGKKDDEKSNSSTRKVSGERNDSITGEKRSSFKKERGKDLSKRTLALQNKKDLLQISLKDGQKQKRLSANEKEVTSSSEDISALPHVKRLEADANKRKSMVGNHTKAIDTKVKTSIGSETSKRKKHSEVAKLAIKGKQSGIKQASKSTNKKGKQTNASKQKDYSMKEYDNDVVYDQQYSENDDHEKDVKRLNNLLTSSFRSRAANKLSSPYCRSSDDKDWLTEGSNNGDELEYEIDWEHLKRGIREHDSSSSYFTAEEISKQSSLESASSSPRGPDCNNMSSLRNVSNESNHNGTISQMSNNDKLFVAGNIDFTSPSVEPRVNQSSADNRENIIDLRFTWDDLGDMRNGNCNNKKTDDEFDQVVNDKSSSDKDSGITSSGEENSRAQIPDSYKMNFLERPIYKLQSISEEDKLTDSEEKETADELSSSVRFLKGKEQKQPEKDRESQKEKTSFDKKSTKDTESNKNIEQDRNGFSLNTNETNIFDIPVEMALPFNTNENYSIYSAETFHNPIISEQVFGDKAEPSMYPYYHKPNTDVPQKDFKGYDYLPTDEFKDALTHIVDSSTMFKSEVKRPEPAIVSESLSEQALRKNDSEEDVYLQEFERLREFERLEEAFQEGKNSSNNSTDEKGMIHITTSVDNDNNQKSESIENLGDDFFMRQPMTPITEESGSSIEDGRIDSKRSSKVSIQEKIIEDDFDDEVDRRQLNEDVEQLSIKPSLDGEFVDIATSNKECNEVEIDLLKKGDIKSDTVTKIEKSNDKTETMLDEKEVDEITKSKKKSQSSKGKGNKTAKKQTKSGTKTVQGNNNDKKQVSKNIEKKNNVKGAGTNQEKKGKTVASKKKKQEQKSAKKTLSCELDEKKSQDKVKKIISPSDDKIVSSEKVSKEACKIERCNGLASSDIDLMLPLDFEGQEETGDSQAFDQLDTSGLEIMVTDITSSKQNKKMNQTVRKKSFENKKKKEKEVNKKVLKVIKLFTEAINKKEMTEGTTDKCISQQIMNSIFNAAKQSTYVEDESQSDLIKTWQESVMNIESHQMEYRNIATPAVGTAVQQYKDLDSSQEKKSEKKSTKSKNKPRIKSSKLKPSNHHIVLSPRKSKNLDDQKNKQIKNKCENKKENRSKIVQKYNNKPKVPKNSLKHTDSKTCQKTSQPTSPRRKIKISNLSRKLLSGSYVSPYRQQSKKTNFSSNLQDEDEDNDFQEIELDVKIKVTQRDEDEDEYEQPSRDHNSQTKRTTTKPRANTFSSDKKPLHQSKIPVIDSSDVKDRKKRSFVKPKVNKAENQSLKEKPLKKRQEMASANTSQKVKRSSSERSGNKNEIKDGRKREERRHSSYHFGSSTKRFSTDKINTESKHNLACSNSFLGMEEKIVTSSSDVDKKEKPYVTNLGSRGPIFPYIGYIERKDLGTTTVDYMKSNNSVQRRRLVDTNPSIQTTIESTMLTSSKPKVGRSFLEAKHTDADSSFAIMSSMSNTGDSMFYHCNEIDTKRADHHIQLDIDTNFDEDIRKINPNENNDLPETKSKKSRLMSSDKKTALVHKSLDEMETLPDQSLQHLGVSDNDTLYKQNGTPKKSTSSKVYHTVPANTGGANLYVESRGAILPYIGHIERLDNEIIKSEPDVKIGSQSNEACLDSYETKEKPEICSTTDLLGKKSKPLLSTSEVPTATVRSSTPNNVALEVKIPIPAELSSSLDPSDSPTLTFNIDVSLENSSDEADEPCEVVKKSSTSKDEKDKSSRNEEIKNMQKGSSARSRKLKFDKKGNGDETYISKGKRYDNKKTDTNQSKSPRKLDETNINIDVEVDCTNIPTMKTSQTKELRGSFLTGSQMSLPDMLSEPVNKSSPKTRSIYPYNHFITQKPAITRRGSGESDSQGKKSRKSWPTEGVGKPFQSRSDRNGSFSSYDSQSQKSDRTTKSGKEKREERVCLGGGLVFNVTKKQTNVAKKQVQSRFPQKQMSIPTRATDAKRTPACTSTPPRSIPKYIPRQQESLEQKGSLKGSFNQSFNDTSDSYKVDELKHAEKVNEEKVNNLVSDIKDAGATISDILDEMQALKMFLNEEEENGCIKDTSQNKNTSEHHLNHSWRNESDSSLCQLSQGNERTQNDWLSYTSNDVSNSHLRDNELSRLHFHESQKSPDSKTTSEITSTSQSFKEKLKEELARSISATLSEIHPYRNMFCDDSLVPTSKNTEQIPTMDDTLREIRTSNEDVESDLRGAVVQSCEEICPGTSSSTIVCSTRDFQLSTFNDLTINTTMQTTCIMTTTAGVLSVRGSVVSSKEKNHRPPPKSYVRPIIFPKTFKATPSEKLSDQSLDSGLHVTNSIDDFSMVISESSNKTLRESFEQQELNLGIIDDKGRVRRNSELVKQLSYEQPKLKMSLSTNDENLADEIENENECNEQFSHVQNNGHVLTLDTTSEEVFTGTGSGEIKTVEYTQFLSTSRDNIHLTDHDIHIAEAFEVNCRGVTVKSPSSNANDKSDHSSCSSSTASVEANTRTYELETNKTFSDYKSDEEYHSSHPLDEECPLSKNIEEKKEDETNVTTSLFFRHRENECTTPLYTSHSAFSDSNIYCEESSPPYTDTLKELPRPPDDDNSSIDSSNVEIDISNLDQNRKCL